jgi:hypothetical protein
VRAAVRLAGALLAAVAIAADASAAAPSPVRVAEVLGDGRVEVAR